MGKDSWSDSRRKDAEVEYAKMCVESLFYCKISTNTRKRNNVEARMVLAKILREGMMPLKTIGFYLKKDHTTIIHYLKQLDDMLPIYEELKGKYIVARNMVNRKEHLNYTEEQVVTHKEEVSSLKKIIDELNLERSYTLNLNTKYNRIGRIIELIERNTPEGNEDLIEKQIVNMFQRIAYKNQS